jgi:ABC-2 type transport system permease protein
VTATFLASPRRWRVVLAKIGAHLVLGVGYGLVGLVVALVAGGMTIAVRGHSLGLGADGLWRSALLGVVAVALWALIGIGIGTLVRNQMDYLPWWSGGLVLLGYTGVVVALGLMLSVRRDIT